MIRTIAFYLPQYHPIPENNEWWGEGFTEWTNVRKAKPLFKGHQQPKVPTDLGYYDLRSLEVRERQVRLAKEAGVYGFCYWHYWHSGKMIMGEIFDQVLSSGSPDFPFCLGWANQTWYKKSWQNDVEDKLLIKQEYPGGSDITDHFAFLLKAFQDKRYITVEGRPLLYIYDPLTLPQEYLQKFNQLAKQNGFEDGLFLVANIIPEDKSEDYYIDLGYDAVSYQRLREYPLKSLKNRIVFRIKQFINIRIKKQPIIYDYKRSFDYMVQPLIDGKETVFPCIIPNWDHTPRSGVNGSVFINATPSNFRELVKRMRSVVEKKKESHQIIFLKSWNEWGEGNYMEPDQIFEKGYIEALRTGLADNK